MNKLLNKHLDNLRQAIENNDSVKIADFVKKISKQNQGENLYKNVNDLSKDEYSSICAINNKNNEVIIATKEYDDWLIVYVYDKDKLYFTQADNFEMIDNDWKIYYLCEYDCNLEYVIMKNIDNYLD